jgi:hypothetical protein
MSPEELQALANAPMSETAKFRRDNAPPPEGVCPWCEKTAVLDMLGCGDEGPDGPPVAICYECWMNGEFEA